MTKSKLQSLEVNTYLFFMASVIELDRNQKKDLISRNYLKIKFKHYMNYERKAICSSRFKTFKVIFKNKWFLELILSLIYYSNQNVKSALKIRFLINYLFNTNK
jgi:hypothetical protein